MKLSRQRNESGTLNTTARIEPNEYLAALGRIVVYMNRLELNIRFTFDKILGKGTGTFLNELFATENFNRLLEVFRLTFHYKVSDEQLRKTFDALCVRLHKLNEERNRYLHSNWFFARDKSRVIRWRRRKWPNGAEQDSQAELRGLEELANDLATTNNELLKFVDQVFPTMSAPRTP